MRLEQIQEHPEYLALVETLMTRSTQAYRVANLKLRTMAHLSERERHKLLQEIQLHESMWRKAKTWLMGVVAKYFPTVIKALSPKSIKSLNDRIQKDRKVLMAKAEQISAEQNLKYTEQDVQAFKNEISREVPKIPQSTIDNFNRGRKPVNEYVDDEAFSTVLFVHKWVLIYILYSIALIATGAGSLIALGFGTMNVVAQYIPLVVLTLYDYVDEASRTEYFVR